MIAIVDYGVGNLFSLSHSLRHIGAEPVVTRDAQVILSADHVILPGVGAFGDAAKKLISSGLDGAVRRAAGAGTPLLGICVGMQLLFDRSYEFGVHAGLGLIPGEVRPIAEVIDPALKIPHIGWNKLTLTLDHTGAPHPILRALKPGDSVYFVHSYAATGCEDSVIATTEYSCPLTAAVARGNVCGTQFHPEKSGPVGLSILKAFCEWSGSAT